MLWSRQYFFQRMIDFEIHDTGQGQKWWCAPLLTSSIYVSSLKNFNVKRYASYCLDKVWMKKKKIDKNNMSSL